jgi:hypothetical protein
MDAGVADGVGPFGDAVGVFDGSAQQALQVDAEFFERDERFGEARVEALGVDAQGVDLFGSAQNCALHSMPTRLRTKNPPAPSCSQRPPP